MVIDARGPADFESFVERLRGDASIIHFDGTVIAMCVMVITTWFLSIAGTGLSSR